MTAVRPPWGLRWWEVAPEAVLAAGLGLFAVTEPSAASSAFSSKSALALMAGTAVLWLAVRLALLRFTDQPLLRLAVFGAAAVAVLAVVVLPAYRDTTVVETLPTAAAPTTTVPAPAPGTTVATATTVGGGTVTTGPAIPAPTTSATTAAAAPPTAPAAGSATPVRVRADALHGIDHRATGSVVVYRQADGTLLVGLEDIDIQPGPDYDVYVVAGADREDVGGGVRLDDLRGNKGTQYYDVPAGTPLLEGQWTVLVWCQTFDVPVAGATPA